MQRHWIIFISFAVLAVTTNAQSEGFNPPTAGFVFSPESNSIRPLLGLPGATHIGGPVLSDATAASVGPDGTWAFVITAHRSGFVRGLSGAPTEVSVDGIIDAVDRVAWNRDASAAILYSSSGRRSQRVRLTAGGQVSIDDPVDLAALGNPTMFAIDPSGGRVAFGIAGNGVYVIDGAKPPFLVASLAQPASVTFSDSGRLYAVDTETKRIVEFDDDWNLLEFAVTDAVEGAQLEPVGLVVSAAGKHLMVIDRGTRTVRVYEIATKILIDTLQLDLAPGHVQRLSTNGSFLLNRIHGKDWLLVLDATDIPRVYFVPAGEEETR